MDNTHKKLPIDERFVGLAKNSYFFRNYTQAKIDSENNKIVDKIINLPMSATNPQQSKKERIKMIK